MSPLSSLSLTLLSNDPYTHDASFDMPESAFAGSGHPHRSESDNAETLVYDGICVSNPIFDSRQGSQLSVHHPSTVGLQCRIASFRHSLPSATPRRDQVSIREMSNYLAIELQKAKPTPTLNLPSVIFPNSSLHQNV